MQRAKGQGRSRESGAHSAKVSDSVVQTTGGCGKSEAKRPVHRRVKRVALFPNQSTVWQMRAQSMGIRDKMRISQCVCLTAIVAENERNGFTFWPNSLVKREDTAPRLGGMQWAVEWVP
jgi:hypothetical protein